MLSTIFTTTDIRFFVISMMILIFLALRSRIETFARFTEIALLLFFVLFVGFFIFLIPTFKLENVWPVTYLDTLPILRASYPIIGSFCYYAFLPFIGSSIQKDMQAHKKESIIAIAFLGVMTTLILVFSIGSLGYRSAARMSLPFFSATKLINILQSFDRLEAILLSAWVVSDFIVIGMFGIILSHVLKSYFKTAAERNFATPLTFIGIVGGIFFASNRFELESFSTSVFASSMHVALGFVVPLLLLAVGKMRGKI
jgi:hypothetical protein